MERYRVGLEIRKRKYVTDNHAWDPQTERAVTLRKINKNCVREITIECSILDQAPHPNIISLKQKLYDEGHVILVLENNISSTLRDRMTYWPADFMDQKKIKIFLKELLCGIAYCHSLEAFYMDLEPETIYIDSNVLKLGDLGTARVFRNSAINPTPQVYTLQYTAPEVLLGSEDYTAAIDIWSIGCIFFEMAVAKKQQERKLFNGKSENEMLQDIFSKLGTPDEQTWPGVSSLPRFASGFPKFPPQDIATLVPELDLAGLDLLSKMLCINPSQRITAKDAWDHEYLKDDVTPGC